MPKKFTDSENEYIKKRLKEEAMKCLSVYGVKRTTVDELVKRVNIPKGTFYLFYESKELLLFDSINDLHNTMQDKMLKDMMRFAADITVENLTEFLFRTYQEVNKTGLLSIILNGEMEYLMRKLPESVVKEHMEHDDLSIEKLFSFLTPGREVNTEALSGAFRGVFLMMFHKHEIGEEIFDEVLKMMLRGLVIQILEDKDND